MHTRKAITAKRIFTGSQMLSDRVIVIENERIAEIAASPPPGMEVLDFGNHTIAPGLIDLQIYGGGGYLFCDRLNKKALHAIADSLVRTGTTGFVLTLATNSREVFYTAAKVVRENPHPAVLGLHFEGPYINPVKKGAHLSQFIKQPSIDDARDLLEETGDVLKIITLAPERCDPVVIRLFLDAGVMVSAGHSNATFVEARSAFNNGIKAVTHLFNAMSPLHHRDSGLPGATYLDENAHASIIADGIHVDFVTLRISKKIMGERLFLITDAVEESQEGPYVHQKQADRFTLPDGTLSGSRLTLLQAVKNCIEKADIPLEEALRMATVYPARLLPARGYGEIKRGNWADFVVFDDDLAPKAVVFKGIPAEL